MIVFKKIAEDNVVSQDIEIARDIEYARVDSGSLLLDIYRPCKEEPVPLILFIHGGGRAVQKYIAVSTQCEFLFGTLRAQL